MELKFFKRKGKVKIISLCLEVVFIVVKYWVKYYLVGIK